MPPNPAKLYLDENMSSRLATQLKKKYGFDVISCHETNMGAKTDREQLAFAISQQRAIVTINVGDFVLLDEQYVAQGQVHWGMVLSTQESNNVLLHRLLRFLNSVSANELKNQIRWLNEFR